MITIKTKCCNAEITDEYIQRTLSGEKLLTPVCSICGELFPICIKVDEE